MRSPSSSQARECVRIAAGLAVSWLHNHELCPHLSVVRLIRVSHFLPSHRSLQTHSSRADGIPENMKNYMHYRLVGNALLVQSYTSLASVFRVFWMDLQVRETDRRYSQPAPSEHNTKVHRASESRWPPLLILLHTACRPCHPSSSIRFSSTRNVKHPRAH